MENLTLSKTGVRKTTKETKTKERKKKIELEPV